MSKEQIIKEAVSGNAKAVETLYKEYYHLMKGVCLSIVKDESVVEDLVHDSFILALISLGKLRNPNRCGEWLTTIVRNVSLKYIENQKRQEILLLSNVEDSLESVYEEEIPENWISEDEILEYINKLPEGYRTVFRLSVIQGFSHEEISQILHIKSHSVSSQLARARKLLKKMLVIAIIAAIFPVYNVFFKKRPVIVMSDKQQFVEERHATKAYLANKSVPAHDSNSLQETSLSVDNRETEISEEERITLRDTICTSQIRTDMEKSLVERMRVNTFTRPLTWIRKRHSEEPYRKSNPWELLAFGSSGSSLLQNVTNMILTGGNTSSGVPYVIHTWEEYADYLESTVHEGMSGDSLTLLHIAQNNKGEMIEQEQHDRPLVLGLSFSKKIRQNLNLNLGIRYSLLKSSFKLGSLKNEEEEDSSYISKRQKIHYLGLPLGLSYNFFSKKSFSTYVALGVTMYVPISGKLNEQYVILPNYRKTIKDTHIKPKIQWNVDVSLGVQYHFSQNWSWYAEPTFKWYIPNHSRYHTQWTEKPCQFSIPFGIRFSW